MPKSINAKFGRVEISELFLIKKCDGSIAGFGNTVWKILHVNTLKLVCYINEHRNLYFPCPIHYDTMTTLLNFIEEYNLGNVSSKVV
jgi:hypothetical protein